MIGPLLFIISTLTSPGFLFLNISILIFFMITNELNNKHYILSILGIFFVYLLSSYTKTSGFKELNELFDNTKIIYYNYFTLKDTLPNFGVFWSLMPEVNLL